MLNESQIAISKFAQVVAIDTQKILHHIAGIAEIIEGNIYCEKPKKMAFKIANILYEAAYDVTIHCVCKPAYYTVLHKGTVILHLYRSIGNKQLYYLSKVINPAFIEEVSENWLKLLSLGPLPVQLSPVKKTKRLFVDENISISEQPGEISFPILDELRLAYTLRDGHYTFNAAAYSLIPHIGGIATLPVRLKFKYIVALIEKTTGSYTLPSSIALPEGYIGTIISQKRFYKTCEKEGDYKPQIVVKRLGHFFY